MMPLIMLMLHPLLQYQVMWEHMIAHHCEDKSMFHHSVVKQANNRFPCLNRSHAPVKPCNATMSKCIDARKSMAS